ncbi:C1 family peptidase [Clostridium intestinale]|uniref:C1 family peptidase n=1 Tax=Clostridium intestinale TaxID=36845 RepID=UPI002DD67EA3|nr:C1 family peptidase [Clostridium intestinale]WRY49786.1 C1 family peptidase [Clostridium intestinale]
MVFTISLTIFPSFNIAKAEEVELTNKGYKSIGLKIKDLDTSKEAKLIDNLPRKFDLRENEGVTTVKDQNPFGTCWAFSSIGAIESSIKYQTGKDLDLSEANLIGKEDGVDGGTLINATGYLANWDGVALEKDDPYPKDSSFIYNENAPISYHVQNGYFLPSRTDSSDNEVIKRTVMDKGAVSITYYDFFGYYSGDRTSYYCPAVGTENHAVMVVGWDDDYPKEKFSNMPSGNGAFLIKNSWGDSYHSNSGYFYISYYDANLGKGEMEFFDTVTTKNDFDNRYTAADLSNNWYYSYSSKTLFEEGNIITAKNDEVIYAIGLLTLNSSVPYEIFIDENYNPINYPNNNVSYLYNNKKVKSGTLIYGGYNTIKLDNPINITKGTKALVAIKYYGTLRPSLNFLSGADESNNYSLSNGYMRVSGTPNPMNIYTFNKSSLGITGISLDKTSVTLNKNQSAKINATVYGDSSSNKEVIWKSSNTKIAVVDDLGNVNSRGNGQALITASTRDGNKTTNSTVKVTYPLEVTNTEVSGSNINVYFNDLIFQGIDFSKITLTRKNGENVPITKVIDHKRLIISINANNKYFENLTLNIPKNSLHNNSQVLINDYFNTVYVNNYELGEVVPIPDCLIRRKVSERLGITGDKLTKRNLLAMRSLMIDEPEIDLSYIGILENLDRVSITGKKNNSTTIKGISEITNLKKLESLTIRDVNITDLDFIENSKKMNNLTIENCNLYNIDGLSYLDKLETLRLRKNNIVNLSPLKNLINIDYLYLDYNKIEDLTPLKNLTNLEMLGLENNSIESLEPLSSLNLKQLSVKNNRIKSLNSIRNMQKLEYLNASYNFIDDISVLEHILNLETIYLDYNFIDDISPIRRRLQNNKFDKTFLLNIIDNFINEENIDRKHIMSLSSDYYIYAYSQKGNLHELNNFAVDDYKLKSATPLVFSFNKNIRKVNKSILGANGKMMVLDYRIDGNKIYLYNLAKEVLKEGFLKFNISINVTTDDGFNESISTTKKLEDFKYISEDVNKDSVVDILDLARIGARYNKTYRDNDWNFDEDINKDGILDIYDLTSISLSL